MDRRLSTMALVGRAAQKLDSRSPEWMNVIAFIQSCYAGRVTNYNMEEAVGALAQLEDEEEHALIAWVLTVEELRAGSRGWA